jgi:glyoxylase-like metal-dependent hydrolase (beta-lactamase superfamily II)
MRGGPWRPLAVALAALAGVGAWHWWRTNDVGYPQGSVSVRSSVATEAWSLHAVEHARSDSVAVKWLVRGAAPADVVDMSWYFYVAVGFGEVVLIDAGTDRFHDEPEGPLARKWSVARSRSVPAALASLGLTPDDVTHVILTHHHWDHVDGVVHLAKAVAHMPKGEWNMLIKHAHGELRAALDAMQAGGGYRGFTKTPHSPLDGLTIIETGRHTAHHCAVRVDCPDGPRIISGDGAYLFRNIEQGVAITATKSPKRNVADLKALVRDAGPSGVVLPGHDPQIFERFPSGVDGIARLCP